MTQPGKCHRQENLNGDSTGRTKKPTIIGSKDKDKDDMICIKIKL